MGALPPDSHRGSTPGLRWPLATLVSRPPNLFTPGKNPVSAHAFADHGNSMKQ